MKICFVCNGNNSRSPMAEEIAKTLALSYVEELQITSCGINAADGEEIAKNTVDVLREIGIDIVGKKRRRIAEAYLADDIIYVALSKDIEGALIEQYQRKREQVKLLGEGIFDPKGCGIEVYRKCRDKIKEELNHALPFLIS